ncbi:thioesterase domain-containing protein [Streptomyces sp. NPDC007808]|uniref:thioesterase domain-containing protein n=1 Tax=Streptomyces sp. NPDC007808 TaxID=3364779 RepID=UPI0036C8B6FD
MRSSTTRPNFAGVQERWSDPRPLRPGQEDRSSDSLPDSLEELAYSTAQACQQFIDAPPAHFGHSMGASIAYETAMHRREQPALLWLTCSSPPDQDRARRPTAPSLKPQTPNY